MVGIVTLENLVKTMIGFPDPESGGTAYFSDSDIRGFINDGFDKMCDSILGLPAFVEFTLDAAGAVVITKPTSGAPTISTSAEEYTYYKVSNARTYQKFLNLTTDIYDSSDRILRPYSPSDPNYQNIYNATSSDYIKYFWIMGDRGFVLLPATLSQENTIHIKYRKDFTRLLAASTGATTFTSGGGPSVGDNLTTGGSFTGDTNADYVVEIDFAGVPDTLKWSDDGGVTWNATGVSLTTAAMTLNNGITITFGASTGHVVGDKWEFAADAQSPDNDFTEYEQRGHPVFYAAYMCALSIRDIDAGQLWQQADEHLMRFVQRKQSIDNADAPSIAEALYGSGII